MSSTLSGPGAINVTLVFQARNLGSNQYMALPQAPFSNIRKARSVGLQGLVSIVLNSIHFLLSLHFFPPRSPSLQIIGLKLRPN